MTSPSVLLGAAMDQAEADGEEIPCKTDPEAFTSDLLAMSGRGTYTASQLVRLCAQCPVLAECREYANDARSSRRTELFGVVAGRLEVSRQYIEFDTKELTHA